MSTPDESAPADTTAFPTLGAAQLERMRIYGRPDVVVAGDFAFVEGQADYDLVVIVDGEFSVVRRDRATGTEAVIAVHGPGRFLGELNLLTGERTSLAARAERNAEIVRIDADGLRRLLSNETELADVLFAAFVARREVLRGGEGAETLRIIGSHFSARMLELASFARRRRLPFTCIDLDDPAVGDIEALLATVGAGPDDTPLVVTPTAVLRRPTVGELADHLGVTFRPSAGRVYDLVVIGAGPCGLAAAVYGASEGLDTLVLDAVGTGGQAGTSSRIENYFGFASGVSGAELVETGALQATRLGAELRAPCRVVSFTTDDDAVVFRLADGPEVRTRAALVAIGVQYRKLPLAHLEHFEGAGVYYAATEMEATLCAGSPVVVVGGGNSAGQAALHLAGRDCTVTIAVRRDLASTMSSYLIDRITADPRIEVAVATEVVELHGDDRLREVTLRTSHDGVPTDRRTECRGLFSFIGAVPHTDWLAGAVALDPAGFVLTDRDVVGVRPDLAFDPLPFETSEPGVFAAGDVRHGSMKRVAAAVGEGSSAVRSIHDHLARPR